MIGSKKHILLSHYKRNRMNRKIMDITALHTPQGERKYLNEEERKAFKRAALSMPPHIRTFGLFIFYTGARTNEALQVTPARLNFEDKTVLIRTLKQNPNKPDKYRLLDVPESFLFMLESEYQAKTRKAFKKRLNKRIWDFTPRSAQVYIKRIMDEAGIEGKRATARGLRHSVGVTLAMKKIPMNIISAVLGHENPANTMIYLNIIEAERRKLVSAIW